MSSISVVISVYSIERANEVTDCIESLKKQTLPPKEIVIVLDPDDKLIAHYKGLLDSSVKLVVSNAFGLSAARNMGIKNCDTDLIAFIDDDAIADPKWLENLAGNFSHLSVIGVGGQIIPRWPDEVPDWFPEELYWVVGCSYKGLPIRKGPIRNPIGCNMAFRRLVFERAGYFRTGMGRVGDILMGHDDTEIGIRATSILPKSVILYDPKSIVYHRVSSNRVSFKYILRRSYSEGYSKAFVSNIYQNKKVCLETERNYLHRLLLSTPKILFETNVKTGVRRCWTLWVASALVFLGYFVGSQSC